MKLRGLHHVKALVIEGLQRPLYCLDEPGGRGVQPQRAVDGRDTAPVFVDEEVVALLEVDDFVSQALAHPRGTVHVVLLGVNSLSLKLLKMGHFAN